MQNFRDLSHEEIKTLENNGCTAEGWQSVKVSTDFDVERVRDTAFFGTILIGSNSSQVTIDGLKRPCGIYRASVADRTIGNNV